MKKLKMAKKYALIAAICYAVFVTYSIYVNSSGYASFSMRRDVLLWIDMIGIAVALFMEKDKILIGAVGINALLEAYSIIEAYSSGYYIRSYISGYVIWKFFHFVTYAALTVFLVLVIKGNDVVKKIWFVPCVATLLGVLVFWIKGDYFSYISVVWKNMLLGIIEIVAIFFVGMWIKENVASTNSESAVNEYATFNPQAVSSVGVSVEAIGGADKLKMYKDLLDCGAITQEEFETKKKQILGL